MLYFSFLLLLFRGQALEVVENLVQEVVGTLKVEVLLEHVLDLLYVALVLLCETIQHKVSTLEVCVSRVEMGLGDALFKTKRVTESGVLGFGGSYSSHDNRTCSVLKLLVRALSVEALVVRVSGWFFLEELWLVLVEEGFTHVLKLAH